MRSTVSWAVKVTELRAARRRDLRGAGWWGNRRHRTFTLAFAANHLGAARGAFDFTVDWCVNFRSWQAAS